MHSLIRQRRRFFLGFALAGLALRMLFFFWDPAITDDSHFYADFATNWLQHGIYGTTQAGEIVPADTRLPGYPAFLAAIFALFGMGNFRAALLIQILLDLGTCLIVADLVRRTVCERAARIAFVLSALCPFLANYAAAALAETPEIFFTAMALDCAAAGLDSWAREAPDRACWAWCAGSGAAIAACILLRPDGGILLASVGLYLLALLLRSWRDQKGVAPILRAGVLVGVCALAPLVPWTIRNFRTLHHFQPLAPRYVSAENELTPRGFQRWVKTWMADYVSVEEIYWNVPGGEVDPTKLPDRAFDSWEQKEKTLAVIVDYNQSKSMTAELDARFSELATERVRAHPLRYYLALPLMRIADMWLRPRTELLPPDQRWWEFDDELRYSILSVAWVILNLGYVGAAGLALGTRRSQIRFVGLLLVFVVIRSAFLGTLENPESRYTLECYPVVIVLASALWRTQGQSRDENRARVGELGP